MKKLLCVVLATAVMLSMSIFASAEQTDEIALTFGDDGKFTVLQISDTQDDHYPAYDMVNLIKLAIEETNPDLIVYTGDIVEDSRAGDFGVDGENGREGVKVDSYEQCLENVKATCEAVFTPAEEAKIPFAVTQGNNDYKGGITNEDWLAIYAEYDYCVTKDESPDKEGRIDYNLEIKSDNGKTVFNIWLMDTEGGGVYEEQLDWYKSESAALKEANGGVAVPSILFQHIPVVEIGNFFEECNFWDEGAVIVDGKCYRLNHDLANGYHMSAEIPGQSSEQFKAWKECGDILGAYFGHWHTEGYTGTWDGIELGMTYGAEFAKPGPYGIRVFTISENDVENYESELYTYEGSVKDGNARLELQVDNDYEVYDSIFEKIIAFFKNTFSIIEKAITSVFA